METYKYKTGPFEKGEPSIRWAVRETPEEFNDTKVAMANPSPPSKRKPMYAVEEIFEGLRIRRWVEYAS